MENNNDWPFCTNSLIFGHLVFLKVLADSVDPDQIALEQYEQGLLCLPVILLNAHNTLIQKHKINVQALKS